MRNILLLNEGYASLITDNVKDRDERTISYWILPIAMRHLKIDEWTEIHSTRITSRKRMERFITDNLSNDARLIVITKSFGGYEFKKFLDSNQEMLASYREVIWISIDPHGFLWQWDKKTIPINQPRNMTTYNFYQHQRFPRGAHFLGADINHDVTREGMNHWAIIRDKEVLSLIKEIISNA